MSKPMSAESVARIAIALAAAEGKANKFPRDPEARRLQSVSEDGVMKSYFRRAAEIITAARQFTKDEASGRNAEISRQARSYLAPEKRISLDEAARLQWVPNVKSRQGIKKRIKTLNAKDAISARFLLPSNYEQNGEIVRRPAWREIVDTNSISHRQAADLNQAWNDAQKTGKIRRSAIGGRKP